MAVPALLAAFVASGVLVNGQRVTLGARAAGFWSGRLSLAIVPY